MKFKFASQIVKNCVGNSKMTLVIPLIVFGFGFVGVGQVSAVSQGYTLTTDGNLTLYTAGFDYSTTNNDTTGFVIYKGTYPAFSSGFGVTTDDYNGYTIRDIVNDNYATSSCNFVGAIIECDLNSGIIGTPTAGDYWVTLFAEQDSEPLVTNDWYSLVFDGSQWVYSQVEPTIQYTRIISINPGGNATTSTSTSQAINITGYISDVDYATGTKVTVYISRDSSTQQTSALMAWESAGAPYSAYFEFPISSSGDFSLSTTTDTSDFLEGRYSIAVSIDLVTSVAYQENGLIGLVQSGWDYFMGVLELANGSQQDTNSPSNIRKVDSFIIGALTYYDEATDAVVSARNNLMVDSAICSPLSGSFEILGCLSFLILPTPTMLNNVWSNLYSNVLTHAPFGYITRFVTLATGLQSSMPVPLTYTFGTSAPEELQGKSIEFQIWDNFGLISEIRSDDAENKNIWEITQPFFELIVGLGVLGVILYDLLNIGIPAFGGGASYPQSGRIPVSQLPDQPVERRVTYGQANNVSIRDNTRRKKMM